MTFPINKNKNNKKEIKYIKFYKELYIRNSRIKPFTYLLNVKIFVHLSQNF